jgi:hypothetical protein
MRNEIQSNKEDKYVKEEQQKVMTTIKIEEAGWPLLQ